MVDNTKSITESSSYFFIGTLLSRISGFGRDIAMAIVFGASPAVAAFMVAFRLSHITRRIFGEGAMQSAFVPQFEELRHKDKEKGFQFFLSLFLLLSFGLLLLIALSMTVLATIVYYKLLSNDAREIVWLTLLLLPSLLFICLYGLSASLLQCEKHYFLSGFAPVALNLCWILGTLSAPLFSIKSMTYLAIAVDLGCFMQWCFVLPKTLSIIHPYIKSYKFEKMHILKKMMFPFFLALGGVLATQVNSALDPLFARYASLSGPAYLWYAIRIEQLPLALFGIALSSAILPPLTRAAKENRKEDYYHFLRFGVLRTLFLMIPATLLLIILGKYLITFIYGHGDFSITAIYETNLCLWGYAVGLVPSSLIIILAPAFYAQNNYRIPLYGSLLSVVSNIVFNSLFVFWFLLGPASVAFATSISAFINVIFLSFSLAAKREKAITNWI